MAQSSIQIEYNDDLSSLTELLARVNRPGDFFASGSLETPMPRLEIEGVGTISFPVPDFQAKEIVAHASRAPYGRGNETLIDSKVRNVWQIAPDKVRLGGKAWDATFKAVLARAVQGLGCPQKSVSAELYKLLLYDAGGFFVSHRDTEKAPGMFGTLVIVLPSLHRGGDLVVRHAGREAVLDLSTTDVSQLTYAAFYADCEHEVRPLTRGNRVCLVYNLIQRRSKTSRLTAPDYQSEIGAATRTLEGWMKQPGAPPKIVFLLEHQYSPAGLSFSGLKNADAAVGKVLSEAAQRAGCAVHLGIVHIEESGAAELTSYPSYGRSRWRHRYDDDEDEEADADESGGGEFEVIDVCDSDQYISNWIDLEDRPVKYGRIPLGEGELLPRGALDGEAPDKQRVTEATGNEGASFERSYHRAAIVLWRHDRYPEVLLQGGVGAALPYLKKRIKEAAGESKSSGRPESRQPILPLAKLIIGAWETDSSDVAPYAGDTEAEPDRAEMLRLLLAIGDGQLLERFIANVVARQYDGSENKALSACVPFLGPEKTGALLSTLVGQNMKLSYRECVDLLTVLVRKRGVKPAPAVLAAHRRIAEAVVQGLGQIGSSDDTEDAFDWREEKAKAVDAAVVVNLLQSLWLLEAGELTEKAAAAMAANSRAFIPDTVLVPALASLHRQRGSQVSQEPAFAGLWRHTAEFLLARSEFPPEPPTDWAQPVTLKCRCADCRELQTFAADPQERVHRFAVRKNRRQHLHGAIESYSLDMTHETERVGSPQTLVCTKTRRRYKDRCRQYQGDLEHLKTLARLVDGRDFQSLLTRVRVSIQRSG